MLAVTVWQEFLNGLGAVLAFLYDLVPNYGIAIILLTIGIRIVLLPLAIKQIRSTQAMQSIQPQVKALQQKHKGDRQRLNTELMQLYKERGVNPMSGCLPLILQFPVLIALFAVLRVDTSTGRIPHIPEGSRLEQALVRQDTNFLGANLQCSATQAGRTIAIRPGPVREIGALECGRGFPVRIPYFALALAMIGTTYYQQRQMQRASPGPVNPQAQMMGRVMPILFGVWGFLFPAGLVLYWTTTNVIQIAQQQFMFGGVRGPEASAAGDGKSAARRSQGGTKTGSAGGAKALKGEAASPRRAAAPKATGKTAPTDGGKKASPTETPETAPSGTPKRGAGGANGPSGKKRRKR